MTFEHPAKDWSGRTDEQEDSQTAPMNQWSEQKTPMQLMHDHANLHSARYEEMHATAQVT